MSDEGHEFILKMCALGDGAVGKTSCIMRFTHDSFGEKYKATIGTNIAVKNIEVKMSKEETVNAQIVLWDLAGPRGTCVGAPPMQAGVDLGSAGRRAALEGGLGACSRWESRCPTEPTS